MFVAWLSVVLLVSPALAGVVWRDPGTGKWIEVTEDQLQNDPRMKDSRANGGSGDDFFGSLFGPGPSSSGKASSTISSPRVVNTRERKSGSSKYTREIPLTESNVQVSAQSFDQGLLQTGAPTATIPIIHPAPQTNPQVDYTLIAKPIGDLCRFQGYSPLTGCPVEATNGCVDRIPCQRTCAYDGYFNYRCLGPQVVSPQNSIALATPAPPPPMSQDAFIANLGNKLRTALESNDYVTLARLLVNAQGSSSSAALAASALSQIAHHTESHQSLAEPTEQNLSTFSPAQSATFDASTSEEQLPSLSEV